MRWHEKRRHDDGAQRVVTRFSIFPTKIGRETRWLEFSKVVQTYHGPRFGWINTKWVE